MFLSIDVLVKLFNALDHVIQINRERKEGRMAPPCYFKVIAVTCPTNSGHGACRNACYIFR